MTGWLLDTNILSELRRPRPEPRVESFVISAPLEQMYVSVATLAEVRFGVERVADPNRRADLSGWLTNHVRPMFAGRVVAITEDVMLTWRLSLSGAGGRGIRFRNPI